jgi:hypothetical protein
MVVLELQIVFQDHLYFMQVVVEQEMVDQEETVVVVLEVVMQQELQEQLIQVVEVVDQMVRQHLQELMAVRES